MQLDWDVWFLCDSYHCYYQVNIYLRPIVDSLQCSKKLHISFLKWDEWESMGKRDPDDRERGWSWYSCSRNCISPPPSCVAVPSCAIHEPPHPTMVLVHSYIFVSLNSLPHQGSSVSAHQHADERETVFLCVTAPSRIRLNRTVSSRFPQNLLSASQMRVFPSTKHFCQQTITVTLILWRI